MQTAAAPLLRWQTRSYSLHTMWPQMLVKDEDFMNYDVRNGNLPQFKSIIHMQNTFDLFGSIYVK